MIKHYEDRCQSTKTIQQMEAMRTCSMCAAYLICCGNGLNRGGLNSRHHSSNRIRNEGKLWEMWADAHEATRGGTKHEASPVGGRNRLSMARQCRVGLV